MTYTYIMYGEKYIFPKFSNVEFKSGEAKIYSNASQMFRTFYGNLYAIV